jgi:hypothetical protein
MYEGKLGNILVFRDAPPGGRSDTVESVAALLDTGEFFRDAANRLWRSAGQRSDGALAGVKQSTLRPSRASQARSAQPARVSERAITPTCVGFAVTIERPESGLNASTGAAVFNKHGSG